jgi:hypothetical protein
MSAQTKQLNLLKQSNQTPENIKEIQTLENKENNSLEELIKGRTEEYKRNMKVIKGLMDSGTTKVKDIIKITGLHPITVYQKVKYLKDSDLKNPKIVSLASKALKNNLKNDNMQAVKLVYDNFNSGQMFRPKQSSGNVINISFDGLSNTDSANVIEGKAVKYEKEIN